MVLAEQTPFQLSRKSNKETASPLFRGGLRRCRDLVTTIDSPKHVRQVPTEQEHRQRIIPKSTLVPWQLVSNLGLYL